MNARISFWITGVEAQPLIDSNTTKIYHGNTFFFLNAILQNILIFLPSLEQDYVCIPCQGNGSVHKMHIVMFSIRGVLQADYTIKKSPYI